MRPVRRTTGTSITEDRLSAALGRIARGTYVPDAAQRNLGLANPSEAGRALAQARWDSQDGGRDPLAASSACTCSDGPMRATRRDRSHGSTTAPALRSESCSPRAGCLPAGPDDRSRTDRDS